MSRPEGSFELIREDLPKRVRGRGRHIEHVAALQRGSTNTTPTPSLTCSFRARIRSGIPAVAEWHRNGPVRGLLAIADGGRAGVGGTAYWNLITSSGGNGGVGGNGGQASVLLSSGTIAVEGGYPGGSGIYVAANGGDGGDGGQSYYATDVEGGAAAKGGRGGAQRRGRRDSDLQWREFHQRGHQPWRTLVTPMVAAVVQSVGGGGGNGGQASFNASGGAGAAGGNGGAVDVRSPNGSVIATGDNAIAVLAQSIGGGGGAGGDTIGVAIGVQVAIGGNGGLGGDGDWA